MRKMVSVEKKQKKRRKKRKKNTGDEKIIWKWEESIHNEGKGRIKKEGKKRKKKKNKNLEKQRGRGGRHLAKRQRNSTKGCWSSGVEGALQIFDAERGGRVAACNMQC